LFQKLLEWVLIACGCRIADWVVCIEEYVILVARNSERRTRIDCTAKLDDSAECFHVYRSVRESLSPCLSRRHRNAIQDQIAGPTSGAASLEEKRHCFPVDPTLGYLKRLLEGERNPCYVPSRSHPSSPFLRLAKSFHHCGAVHWLCAIFQFRRSS